MPEKKISMTQNELEVLIFAAQIVASMQRGDLRPHEREKWSASDLRALSSGRRKLIDIKNAR